MASTCLLVRNSLSTQLHTHKHLSIFVAIIIYAYEFVYIYIGWEENMARHNRGVVMPPVAPGGMSR